jgi:hypothetical protein
VPASQPRAARAPLLKREMLLTAADAIVRGADISSAELKGKEVLAQQF